MSDTTEAAVQTNPPVAGVIPAAVTAPLSAPVIPAPKAEPVKEPAVDLEKLIQSPAIQEQLRLAAEAAFQKGSEAAKREAEQIAARAKLEEADRLRLEKQDAETATQQVKSELEQTKVDLGIARTLAEGLVELADNKARKFLEFEVKAYLKENPLVTPEVAARQVLDGNPYLLKKATQAPAVVEPKTTIVAPPSTVTTTNSTPAPVTVDTLSMSKAEYQAYKQKQHAIG